MSKNNRVCKACGEAYYFCPNCSGAKATEKYKLMFCSKNCRDVFQTCVAYNMNHITKDEAMERLSQLDLSKKDYFSEQLKVDIDAIMKVDVFQAEVELPVVDIINIEEQPVEVEFTEKKYKRAKKPASEVTEESVTED